MDEGLGRNQRVTPGVSRRDISWRADRPRSLPGIRALPAWADAIVLISLAVYLMLGLAVPSLSRSEAVQISLTRDARVLITHPATLLPDDADPSTQEAVRLGYGSFTRYLAAPGWYITAGREPRPLDLSATDPPGSGQVAVTPIQERHLVAARAGPAVFAALSLFMLFFLARRLLGRPAATVAVLIFALQPAVLSAGRQVSDSGITVLLGLAAIFVAAGIGARLAGGEEPSLSTWTGLGVLAGLCLAAGLTAAPFVAGAIGFCLAGVVTGQARRQRALMAGEPASGPGIGRIAAWLVLSVLGTMIVWVLVSPSLWGWLPERLEARHDNWPWMIARGLVDNPGDRGWQGRLHALPRLLDGPPASLVLYGAAVVGVVVLVLAARSAGLPNLSRRVAVALLIWAAATVLWFVLWPSVQNDHEVPLLVVASLMAASLVAWAQHSGVGRLAVGSGWSDQLSNDRG
jgi:hypothetical protein